MKFVLKRRAAKSLMIGSFVLLNACAVSKESFDCPSGKGVGCHAIHEVNEMVNAQSLTQKSQVELRPLSAKPPAVSIPEHLKSEEVLLIQRIPEQSLKIWFAPFTDSQGYFHEASTVHVVLKPGSWQIEESF